MVSNLKYYLKLSKVSSGLTSTEAELLRLQNVNIEIVKLLKLCTL